jgi:hypothetical protein
MRSGVTRVAALAVLLLAGFPAAASAATLTASSPRTIKFGKTAKVKGNLSGNLLGNSNIPVELQVKLFPYKGAFKTIDTTNTDASGAYSFTAKPDRSARYRVVATDGSATSPPVKTFVNAIVTTTVRGTPTGMAIATMQLRFSTQVSTTPFTGRPLYWYYKPSSATKFRRVATTKTSSPAAGKIGGKLTYKLPKKTANQAFSISWCFRPLAPTKDHGLGDPSKAFPVCPK